ncbi:LacI family DNA-binding transcriptional regulator [Flaviaesturariibacter amylovorans]|uniref:LacI family DNA-binding transcriptional regulator n=1 Tax=Flaviaesturariibacter amylovorans TaxID=1084520 RepID=A0ABP8H6U7_9BACT
MDPINIRQLAEKLNLSVSTVSKAFRNSYDINPQTRERILALARELNYQPNPAAASLRTQQSKTLAVILPAIDNTFFVQALKGIETVARQRGYHVLIYVSYDDHDQEVALTNSLQRGRIDGVLMSIADAGKDLGHLSELGAKGIPVVFFDRVYEHDDHFQVTTNDRESAYSATAHLLGLGCRRIAHLTLDRSLSIADRRRQGYLDALRDYGIAEDPDLVFACPVDAEQKYEALHAFLARERPEAVFSSFENLALLTYQACASLALRIPQDLKIISFSNLEAAPLLSPALSTVHQRAYEIGSSASGILIDLIEQKPTPGFRKLSLPATLELRTSTIG